MISYAIRNGENNVITASRIGIRSGFNARADLGEPGLEGIGSGVRDDHVDLVLDAELGDRLSQFARANDADTLTGKSKGVNSEKI